MTRLLTIAAAAMLAAPLLPGTAGAQTETNQITGLKLSGDKPIQIESDKLEVDQNKNLAVFTGNVSVVQGPTLLKAGRLTVHYSDDKKEDGSSSGADAAMGPGASDIERLEADGKVYIKSEDQVATGDHGSFDMSAQMLTLSGDRVVLTQGENVIVGCKLTVHTQTGQARLDGCGENGGSGRVKMLLKPESQDQNNQ